MRNAIVTPTKNNICSSIIISDFTCEYIFLSNVRISIGNTMIDIEKITFAANSHQFVITQGFENSNTQ